MRVKEKKQRGRKPYLTNEQHLERFIVQRLTFGKYYLWQNGNEPNYLFDAADWAKIATAGINKNHVKISAKLFKSVCKKMGIKTGCKVWNKRECFHLSIGMIYLRNLEISELYERALKVKMIEALYN